MASHQSRERDTVIVSVWVGLGRLGGGNDRPNMQNLAREFPFVSHPMARRHRKKARHSRRPAKTFRRRLARFGARCGAISTESIARLSAMFHARRGDCVPMSFGDGLAYFGPKTSNATPSTQNRERNRPGRVG